MAAAHRVYAEALLEAAKDKDRLQPVREEFEDFVAAVRESDELREFLRNPAIEPGQKRAALEALLAGGEEVFTNFMLLLAEKNRIAEVEEVYEEWERALAREERVLELELITAVELPEDEADRIIGEIERAAGRKVEVTRHTDADLIGGLVLQAGSRRIDASVRGRLEQLREELVERR
jgi:F-type H+-transporting ATPase subunit delta